MVLCTDDSGVFATSLSREYALAAGAFKLSERQLTALALKAVDYCFLEPSDMHVLRHAMQHRLTNVSFTGDAGL